MSFMFSFGQGKPVGHCRCNRRRQLIGTAVATLPSPAMEKNDGDDQLYIPQVADDRKPKIGMEFSSLEEAFSFYNQYAREAGFSARINNSKKNKMTNEVVWKKFVCFKEGHTDQLRSNKDAKGNQQIRKRAHGEVRTGCKSNISLVKEKTGPNWVISNLMESHNHPLSTSSKVHLLRSHRNISAIKKTLTQQFSEANMPTCQQMQLLEIEYGGSDQVGCTERDIRKFEKELRDDQKGIDVETLIELFASEKEKNSAFFFDYGTDSDNRFRCFWTDHVSRTEYIVFGDVVVFDTTYNTNKYGLIFASFVGVNHHHQAIIFGCGFISDEKIESFVWLLNKFIEALPKGAPNVIITDQDPVITKAIAQVFPQTMHRYCLWHILNKFSHKLQPLTFRDYYQSIKNVIENSTTPDEFEKSWEDVIKCANLQKNDWLSLMYELRHKWVPVYFSLVFCAGISSSQRSEGSYSFFKKYFKRHVLNKNSLMDFITRFNRALRHQRHNELVADYIDVNEHPKIQTNWPMETQMVKLYTKKKWVEFQNEMSESHGYYVQQTSIGVELVVYQVMNFQSSSSKPKVLTHDKQRDYISCSCRKFEFEGIPCRHMLAFFRINQVFHLPNKYILKRWTRDAKVGAIYALGKQNFINDPERFLMSRHSRLSYKASLLIDNASLTDEGTNFLDEQFDCIYSKIQEMNISRTCDNESQRKKSMDEAPGIIDPSSVRIKGCEKRLKSSKEKSTSKSRLCRGCGHLGESHDKCKCPILQEGSTEDNHHNSDDDPYEEDLTSIAGSNNMH